VEWTGDSEVVVFLTQDAVLSAPDSLEKLIASFVDPEVGAAYGRQLPRSGASLIAAHARLFNYPPVSRIKSIQDAPELGVKTFFISNSFAAYRRAALMEVGGFPHDTILAEDNIVSARMLLNGWKVAYVADAQVYHSHNYTLMQEFRRYFDIGAFHSHESWILERFGRAEGEGARFVRSELLFLWREGPTLIPSSVLRTAAKFIAYRLFAIAKFLPVRLKKRLSMQAHLSRPE
jgi:rhamnosyltransferase